MSSGCGPANANVTTAKVLLISPTFYVPVPASFTLCGLPPPLSEIARVADRDPFCVGVNVTLTVQMDFPAQVGKVVAHEIEFNLVECTRAGGGTKVNLAARVFSVSHDASGEVEELS